MKSEKQIRKQLRIAKTNLKNIKDIGEKYQVFLDTEIYFLEWVLE